MITNFRNLKEVNRLNSKKTGGVNPGSENIENEFDEAISFLDKAKIIFSEKKQLMKNSGNILLQNMVFEIENYIEEIENMINAQEIDKDTFLLYKLRNKTKDLKEKIEFIEKI